MGRISCPDFIGRAEESRALDAALARAAEGAAPTVFVGGEAGIGKSRLVAELAHRARAGGARVLTGGCAPFGSSPPPFTPVLEALRTHARSAGEDERARLVARAPALAWLLPELAGEAAWHRREGLESGQGLVFELLLGVLEDVAADGPLLVVLEDLHWADRSTLDLLALRARTARVAGCTIAGTYRSDELAPGHSLRLHFAELDRTGRTERLELRRFGRAELVAQLAGILGRAPAYALVEDVHARSEGNPFLAEELLAAGGAPGAAAPASVRDIVLARVETLSAPAQRLLGVLSAARRSLSHDALGAAADVDEAELEAALREALANHVVVRAEGDAYAFRHALTREAVYAGLLAGERRRVHEALARAPGDPTPERLADRAHHWYAAGDDRRALAAAVRAGSAVDEVYAHAEALTQYERALALWARVDAPEALAGTDRIALLARAAEAAHCLGDPARAAALIGEALDAVDRAAEPVRTGLMLERLGRYAWVGGDTDRALAAYEEATAVMPDAGAPAERAAVIAALGHAQLVLNHDREAAERCAEGLAIARAAGAVVVEGRALATLGAATASLGERADGMRMLHEGRALLEGADAAPEFVFATYAYEAGLLTEAGEHAAALAAVGPGIDLMRRHGMHRSHRSWLEGVAAAALLALGRWDEADALLAAAHLRGPTGITRRMVQVLRAELALARGDLAAAAEAAADGRDAGTGEQPFAGRLAALAAGLALERRDHAAARAAVARGLAVLEPLDDVQATAWLCLRGLEVEADAAERARARREPAGEDPGGALLDRVRALPRRASAELPALIATCEAEAARAAGRPAAERWRAAAAAWAAVHQPFPRARCLARAAEAGLAERAPRAAVAEDLRAADELAGALGAAPLQRTTASLAQRGRVPLAPAAAAAPAAEPEAAAPHGLTPREVEVLRLVGRGYTNGQIASTLFISRKTAAAHVSHILGKLGVGRRAEAAAVASRLDLLDEAPAERLSR